MSQTKEPTLNENYNWTLAQWAASGHDSKPECEDCGTDLTGQHVRETRYGWFCVPCAEKPRAVAHASWREDFHSDG
ncbi:MAG: hypothetical protein ACRETL_02120 [Gammaproteobacteria bacterium]